MDRRGFFLAASAASLLCIAAWGADWPQWRGPQRDGMSAEKGLLKQWPKGGPKLLWQIKDAGYGFGSPSVVGSRLYLIGNKGLSNEFVRAFDLANGRPAWTTNIGKVGNPDQQPNYPGARSTPTVDGKLLYALGSDGDLACLETATGKLRWKKSLRKEFAGKPGIWAYAESPLVDGGKVVVTPGGERATFVALDKNSGGLIWNASIRGVGGAGYSSAVPLELSGSRQYVQFLEKGVVGVDAATGKFLWRYDKTIDPQFGVHAATAVVSGSDVYTASGGGGGLVRIRRVGNSITAQPVYVQRKAPINLGGSVKVGDYLYGTTNAVLLCTEFGTGKVRWEERSVGAASICYADGRLYLHGEDGSVALVDATPDKYVERGRFSPPNPPERGQAKAWAHPVVASGRLLIRDAGSVWCYDIREAGSSAAPAKH